MFLSKLTVLGPLILSASVFSAAAFASPMSRMETTNRAESAPLNLVGKNFIRLEKLTSHIGVLQRLTYRAHGNAGARQDQMASLRQLILNVSGGPNESSIQAFEELTSDFQIRPSIDRLLSPVIASRQASAEEEFAKLGFAIKAALARTDVKLYSAHLTEKQSETRVLILIDQETNEILILLASRT